ncbi:LamG domain-containing protein [Rufibacter immobilis]|uniref:LamG domain-containing protein n=1 Tax=Rufibacter immobilis TaxID=1348778 RepID=A0A3M9N1C6_9BACT|nr:LamG-like jellyroll fold domain-containing protein [Rufibacter immobilis]RNI30963.1 LamG domain-containing protein [Rufibacter immobilis]
MRNRKFSFYSAKTLMNLTIRRYASFDGVNDYIRSENLPINSLSEITGLTLAAWVKFISVQSETSGNVRYGSIAGQSYLGSYPNGYGITVYNNTFSAQVRINDTVFFVRNDSLYHRDELWHRVVMTVDLIGKTIRLYVDTVLAQELPLIFAAIPTARMGEFRVGINNANRYPLKARVREVVVHSTVWSSEDITNDYSFRNIGRGLLLRYKLDGNVQDSSGNNNHGTALNGVTYENDITKYTQFDGVDDYIESTNIGDSIDFTSSSFTIELWAKRTRSGTADWMLTVGSQRSTSKIIHMGYSGDRLRFSFWGTNLESTETFTDTNVWIHWAVTYDNPTRTASLFMNGVFKKSIVFAANFTGANVLQIGGTPNFLAYSTLKLSNLRFWNTVRTQEQIQGNMTSSFTAPQPNLVANYRLDSDTLDSSGNNNHGTAYNGVTFINE